ncbi:MAG: hypothetical protein M4579_006784 [Chaenotheca gracillima]|nr:MAG: hypothetical protein M4579_006784 [Chaenotheca gracillima]
MTFSPIFKKAYWTLAAAGATYILALLLFTNESLQRHALYLHKLNAGSWQDLNKPEQFGFSKNQISPFNINTPDDETLYAWLILPIGLYAKHEDTLLAEPTGLASDITKTTAFDLLTSDPESRLVINCGSLVSLKRYNAGTVAQGWRTDTYRSLSAASSEKIFVLAVDYRGFGYSTGDPSEEGVIIDAVATVNWALEVARIPSERIVLLGQSLGTAVTTAVAEHYITLDPKVEFAGVVLVAGFTDIPGLMLSYSFGGIFPVLGPLKGYPWLQKWFANRMKDTWDTKERIKNIVQRSDRVRLSILHAKSDRDIPWQHAEGIFQAAANGTSQEPLTIKDINQAKQTSDLGEGGILDIWDDGKNRIIRKEVLRHGG